MYHQTIKVTSLYQAFLLSFFLSCSALECAVSFFPLSLSFCVVSSVFLPVCLLLFYLGRGGGDGKISIIIVSMKVLLKANNKERYK